MPMQTDRLWLRDADLPPGLDDLRLEVREFLDVERAAGSFTPQCNAWLEGHDPSFSRKLGARGWLGMTWPTRFGGRDSTGLQRFVVLEELLAAGAPVAAHWIAERQTGPSLLRFGTEAQRSAFLPQIAKGECYFAIGMSEPDSGSDLAAVRTRAVGVEGGWRLSGSKVWTSHAMRSHYMVALCRTSSGSDRHEGLSQLIVDLHAPGVGIRPIAFMDGTEHFAEVVLDEVFVEESMLLGDIGEGWRQVTAELAYERSGPERILSTFPLLGALTEQAESCLSGDHSAIGGLVADVWALRLMSRSVAKLLDEGIAPQTEAALVKDLGTQFETAVVETANRLAPRASIDPSTEAYARLLAQATMAAPEFTLRGGTTEIIRGLVAKDLLR